MTRTYDWDVFAGESPTEIHHQDCTQTPASHPTGDANAVAVRDPETYAEGDEEFDVSCSCLDPLLGEDRHDDEPMRRTPGVTYEPEGRADVFDFITDYALDAIDAGVAPVAVVVALQQATEEIQDRERDA